MCFWNETNMRQAGVLSPDKIAAPVPDVPAASDDWSGVDYDFDHGGGNEAHRAGVFYRRIAA